MARRAWTMGVSFVLLFAFAFAFAGCGAPKASSPTTTAPPTSGPPRPTHEVVSAENPEHRKHTGAAEVLVPARLALVEGAYDTVVHFHGGPKLQEEALERARVSCVVVSVNVGVQSGPYGTAFHPPSALPALLDHVEKVVHETPGLAEAKRGRLALSAWSAGAASVSAVLANGSGSAADAVLLSDGLFTGYVDPKKKTLFTKGLEPVAAYVERAKRGEVLFVLTHTSIPTEGFPSMPETAGELLRLTGLEKRAPASARGPATSNVLYEAGQGRAFVTGYDGQTAADHISQIKTMHLVHFAKLREAWSAH
ncbi:MAG: hypothetical protein U0183_09695 [Polyangiaceae bacterium]